MIIDADTHVLEGEHTWDYLEPHEERFRPVLVPNARPEVAGYDPRYWWMVDGITRKRGFDDLRIPEGIRDLTDVAGRVSKMDEFGVDVQVIYPSLQLAPTTEKPEGILAMARSYNRFVANACRQSGGRLRWILIPPIETMPEALAELDFGSQHGACGILLHGYEGRRVLSDAYFDPLYAKAQALNLPICVHVGLGNRMLWDILFQDNFGGAESPVLAAFHNVLFNRVPDRFPKLRFGFIEAGAQWVPYLVGEVMRFGAFKGVDNLPPDEKDLVASKRMFISCRIQDDLNYILNWTGDKNLITGTDYGHNDASTELFAFRDLPKTGNISQAAINGILGANAEVFYGLN
jgi:predicted TIM-barrel fold metal-dependent hydrolase